MRATDKDSGLTAERLRHLVSYDKMTGCFVRLVSRGSVKAGAPAGRLREDGYVDFAVDGRLYLAHRLAWLYVTGEWPEFEVDHRDLDKANNSWGNLRQATHGQNNSNSTARNERGTKGVYPSRSKLYPYLAVITVDGKRKRLGAFVTEKAAGAAYAKAAQAAFGEFARAA